MGERTDKSFLVEASIISISNFAVKIIGVLFSIPLSNLLQGEIAVFNAAYSVYAMLYMISTAGLPVATSRMVAASAKRGRAKEARQIYKICLLLFGVIGFVFALAMFVFADKIALWTTHYNSVYAMRVIAPTLFFICVVSAIRGYLQGLRNMVPTAVSQFIEAFFKLSIGLGMAYWSNSQGHSPAVQAAFAVLGITVGVFFGMIYLIIYSRFSKNIYTPLTDYGCDSNGAIIKKLAMVALPVTITSSALYMSHFADTIIVKKALIGSGFSEAVANEMYGAYTGLSTKLADLLPSTFVFPIAISILPAISGALAAKKQKEADEYIHSSMRISGIIALPCSALLFVLARPLICVLFGSTWGKPISMLDGDTVMPVDLAATALSILAIGIFFISLVSTTNALLQAIGKAYLPMIAVSVGAVCLVVSDLILVNITAVNIYGAPIGTLICYIVAFSFNTVSLKRSGVKCVSPVTLYAKPFIAAVAAGAASFGIYTLCNLISGDGRLVNLFRLGISGVVGLVVYCVVILLIKGITEKEIRLLPMGNKIATLLLKLRIIK
ncbi:MAG: polysaccharide biosynthesis protein [Ruminococcaceae bacterium]|nr:polysaccharide biosynthesis protein [Oscillospiraceae bacterium]